MSNNALFTAILLPGFNGTDGLVRPFACAKPAQVELITSSYPTQHIASYTELEAMVRETIARVTGPFILIGESYAGPLALMLADNRPAGLMGVVLVGTFVTPPHPSSARWLPWDVWFKFIRPIYLLGPALPPIGPLKVLRAGARELRKVAPEVLADRMKSLLEVDASAALTACQAPILYCRGRRDLIVPESNLRYILQLKPTVSVARFDTGHFMLREKPDEVWRAILGFAVGEGLGVIPPFLIDAKSRGLSA